MNRLRLKCQYDMSQDALMFLLCELDFMSQFMTAIAEPVVMKKKEEGVVMHPTFHLSMEAAQQLMDQLWRCGIRPKDAEGTVGTLAAKEEHIKDLRKMLFDVKTPEEKLHAIQNQKMIVDIWAAVDDMRINRRSKREPWETAKDEGERK